jgi:hypothetical protein
VPLLCRLGGSQAQWLRDLRPGHPLRTGNEKQICVKLVHLRARGGRQRDRHQQILGQLQRVAFGVGPPQRLPDERGDVLADRARWA